jgi:D-serine deaminase-like pyridoxal phosphate-dependent protein
VGSARAAADRSGGRRRGADPADRSAAATLEIGDLVWFRHAKAGEVAEHVTVAHLLSGDAIVDVVPTYRGTGNAW